MRAERRGPNAHQPVITIRYDYAIIVTQLLPRRGRKRRNVTLKQRIPRDESKRREKKVPRCSSSSRLKSMHAKKDIGRKTRGERVKARKNSREDTRANAGRVWMENYARGIEIPCLRLPKCSHKQHRKRHPRERNEYYEDVTLFPFFSFFFKEVLCRV